MRRTSPPEPPRRHRPRCGSCGCDRAGSASSTASGSKPKFMPLVYRLWRSSSRLAGDAREDVAAATPLPSDRCPVDRAAWPRSPARDSCRCAASPARRARHTASIVARGARRRRQVAQLDAAAAHERQVLRPRLGLDLANQAREALADDACRSARRRPVRARRREWTPARCARAA